MPDHAHEHGAASAHLLALSPPVCGDGLCEEEEELCSTCPADCGQCPMSPSSKLAIALPLGLLCSGFVLTALVRAQRHAHKPSHSC